MQSVKYYIYFYRKRLGLSQVKLAEVLKIGSEKIRAYELGTSIPNEQFIDKFYNGLSKYKKEGNSSTN